MNSRSEQSKLVICPYCTNEVPSGYRFCLQCGAELRNETVVARDEETLVIPKTIASQKLQPTIAAQSYKPAGASEPPYSDEEPLPTTPSDARLRWFAAGAGSLVLVILVGAIILSNTSDSNDNVTQSRPKPSPALALSTSTATPNTYIKPEVTPTPAPSSTITPSPDKWSFIGNDNEQSLYYKLDSIQVTSPDTCVIWTKSVPLTLAQKREEVVAERSKQGLSIDGYESYSDTRVLLALRCKTSEWSMVENADYNTSGKKLSATQVPDDKREWNQGTTVNNAGHLLKAVCPVFCCQPGTQ